MTYPAIPQLKLKYSITQTTPLGPKAAIDLLVSKLKEREYEILEETDDSLIFYSSPWRLRWNFQRAILFDGGNVNIAISNGSSVISFNYYLDFFPPLLVYGAIIVLTAIEREYDGTIFFGCFIVVTGFISIIRAKIEAKIILRISVDEDAIN